MSIREHHARPAVELADTEHLPEGTLALLTRATAEQHMAILELRELFASRGGILTDHFLTAQKPSREIKELEDCKSFAVLNFSPSVTVQVGFGGAAATAGGGMPVPPQSFVQLPVETNLAEIAAAVNELEGVQQAMVFFIRFRHLVHLEAGPLNSIAGGAGGGKEATSILLEYRNPEITPANSAVANLNAARKGIEIQNIGEHPVWLGLDGEAPEVGKGIMLQPGASWNGTISGVLWRGVVRATAKEGANSFLSIVEV